MQSLNVKRMKLGATTFSTNCVSISGIEPCLGPAFILFCQASRKEWRKMFSSKDLILKKKNHFLEMSLENPVNLSLFIHFLCEENNLLLSFLRKIWFRRNLACNQISIISLMTATRSFNFFEKSTWEKFKFCSIYLYLLLISCIFGNDATLQQCLFHITTGVMHSCATVSQYFLK